MSVLVGAATAAATVRVNVGGNPPFAILEDPPPMTLNPLIVNNLLPGEPGFPSNATMGGRDVKITMPTNRPCNVVLAVGGVSGNPARNIWIVGGQFNWSATSGTAIRLTEFTGTAFVEGVDIDTQNSFADAIASNWHRSTTTQVIIQNSRMRGMGYGANHGDMYHAQGGENAVKRFLMQNCRGEIIVQGIFVPYMPSVQEHGVHRMELDHVEMVLDTRFNAGGAGVFIYASPLDGGGWPDEGQSYNEVYLNWYDPHYPTTQNQLNHTTPSAVSFLGDGTAVFSASDISAGQITGAWKRGNPPTTFVPLNKIGLTYDRSFFTG